MFDYEEYKKINQIKRQEYLKYQNWEIAYDEQQYLKSIFYYLNEIKTPKVWQVILVYNKIIVSKPKNQVYLEWYIPAWSQLINPNLATSIKTETSKNNNTKPSYQHDYYGLKTNIKPQDQTQIQINNEWTIFTKIEYRNNRIFAYSEDMDTWIYEFAYLIQTTHKGIFTVKPTHIWEFYTPEVFWRTNGITLSIE